MRLGLDLRKHAADDAIEIAGQADRLGIWAVLVTATAGAETALAAEIAVATEHVHLAVQLDPTRAHWQALAEEIAILDQLSARRALAVIDGDADTTDRVRRLLAAEVVDGVVIAPTAAQTAVPTWQASELVIAELPGDLGGDLTDARAIVDDLRDGGATHGFATWAGPTAVFARHLATRALTPDFPDLVADYADAISPNSTRPLDAE